MERWWTDDDVEVFWTAVDRHAAPHQETGESHGGNACLTNDALAALSPTIVRIRLEAYEAGAREVLRMMAREADGEALLNAAAAKWADLFGIDPDYTGGKLVEEWLDEQRGEA